MKKNKVVCYIKIVDNDEAKVKQQKEQIEKYCLKMNYEIVDYFIDMNSEDSAIESLFSTYVNSEVHKIIITDFSTFSNDMAKLYDYCYYAEKFCYLYFETIKNGVNYDFDIKLLEGVNKYV